MIVALGDVAGKGSPAALLMALLLAIFRTLVDEGLEPAALVARLNVQVCRHSPASRFITLFFAACDPATGRTVYVNAGHLPALLRRRDGTVERLTAGGIALGMFDASTYEAAETTIEPGDTLVLYSDGVTEAENHKGQPFEESGLERVVDGHAFASPTELAQAILRSVEAHAQETFLADDVTVLVMKRKSVIGPVIAVVLAVAVLAWDRLPGIRAGAGAAGSRPGGVASHSRRKCPPRRRSRALSRTPGPSADRAAAGAFAETYVFPGITRAVVRERDRAPAQGSAAR